MICLLKREYKSENPIFFNTAKAFVLKRNRCLHIENTEIEYILFGFFMLFVVRYHLSFY